MIQRYVCLGALLFFVHGCSGSKNQGSPAPGSTSSSTSGTSSTSGGSPPAGSTTPATLGNCAIFPGDNPWNQDISKAPKHPNSDAFIGSIGSDKNLHPDFGAPYQGEPLGIPFVTVGQAQAKVNVSFTYASESDPGPYPIPKNAPIEGGPNATGDRHVLVIEKDNCLLYELFNATPMSNSDWKADSGAIFNLKSNELRPDRWTSADAAGLPVFAGLVRYDEVVTKKQIAHALRFTVSKSQKAYIKPATHAASSDANANLPPMGLRVRMLSSYDCGGFSSEVQVICTALKRYGMFVADNGSDWFVSGAPDDKWDSDNLNDLKKIKGSAFEAVDTGPTVAY